MRIHHLNCISSCPVGGKLMDGRAGSAFERATLTCHCLLVETEHELVLVDTGYGLRDVEDPRARLSAFFLALLQPDLRREMTAIQQIRRLGFDPADVRHIVLTHLDFDHAGGLDDFPWATVHLLRAEYRSATHRSTWLDRQRYRPQQWATREHWQKHEVRRGTSWLDFHDVCPLDDVSADVLMIPLIGHTLGHAGIAVRDGPGWLLLAGDAYFHRDEMRPDRPTCTPGLRLYQWLMDKDRRMRLANQERLRDLVRVYSHEVRVICSHDPSEFESISGRRIAELPSAVHSLDVTHRLVSRADDARPPA